MQPQAQKTPCWVTTPCPLKSNRTEGAISIVDASEQGHLGICDGYAVSKWMSALQTNAPPRVLGSMCRRSVSPPIRSGVHDGQR